MFSVNAVFSYQPECNKSTCYIKDLTINNRFTLYQLTYEQTTLNFTNCTILSMPMQILKKFTNLMSLNISHSGIKSINIERQNNETFPILEKLDASYNSIIEISKETFLYFSNLKILDLSNNQIQVLDESLFASSKNLLCLNFSNNLINNSKIYLNENLRIIDLSNNRLTAQIEFNSIVFNNTFKKNELIPDDSLSILDLSFNSIEKILFNGNFSNILFININSNKLIDINLKHLRNNYLPNLKKIAFDNNHVLGCYKYENILNDIKELNIENVVNYESEYNYLIQYCTINNQKTYYDNVKKTEANVNIKLDEQINCRKKIDGLKWLCSSLLIIFTILNLIAFSLYFKNIITIDV